MAIDPPFKLTPLLADAASKWERLPILVEVPGVSRVLLTEWEYQHQFEEMTLWCCQNCRGEFDRRGDFADCPSRDVAFKFEKECEASLFKMRFV